MHSSGHNNISMSAKINILINMLTGMTAFQLANIFSGNTVRMETDIQNQLNIR